MDQRRYLERIGYDGPLATDHATLTALQRAHLLSVPFDALDCLLGNRVTVEPADAYAKVVERGRGGFCFELNGLFAWLLESLGFDVTRLAARPVVGEGRLAEPFAHLTLLVALERRWLVDVGFGAPFALEPIDLDARDGLPYRVRDADGGLIAEEAGAAEPNAYWFTLQPVAQADFAARCADYATNPESVFVRRGPVAQNHTDGWEKVTRTHASGMRGGKAFAYELTSETQWRSELERRFGFQIQASGNW